MYWYKCLFLAELIISEIFFVRKLKRRDKFVLRAIVSVVLLFLTVFFIPVFSYDVIWMSVLFLSIFALTIIAIFFCFNEPFWNVLFCGIAAYTVQHIAYLLYTLAINLLGFSLIPLYKPEDFDITSINGWIIFIYLISYLLTYWSAYFLLSNNEVFSNRLKLGYSKYVILSGLIVLIDVILNMITEYNDEANIVSRYLEWIYNFITCILALVIQFGMVKQKKMKSELEVVNKLLKSEEKQYRLIKANIDAINVKVHDLKHYVHALKGSDKAVGHEELTEIENLVSFYESMAKTGNDTLDIILSEKLYYCLQHSIKMTYIVDGKLLDFIKDSDIYALFGNALDNAIESVLKLDEDKRNISFSVKRRGNIVLLHIENYYKGKLRLKNGLPVTDKENTEIHGFGMLSMRTIAEKYNGTLSVELVNNIFNLNIVFIRNAT